MRPAEPETLTIYERSRPGRRAFAPPPTDVPETPVEELLPEHADGLLVAITEQRSREDIDRLADVLGEAVAAERAAAGAGVPA